MVNIKRITTGLECCLAEDKKCKQCPYHKPMGRYCLIDLMRDALTYFETQSASSECKPRKVQAEN